MEGFKITWRFDRPIHYPDHPIHLDGLLAYAKVRRAYQDRMQNPETAQHDLPLDRTTGDDWVFKASQVILKPESETFQQLMIRRTDVAQMAKDQYLSPEKPGVLGFNRDKIDTLRGAYKNHFFYIQLRWVAAEAYGVGDIEGVRDLLSEIQYIGKYRRNTWGRIAEWTLERSDDALELWKLRVLPEGLKKADGVDYMPVQSTVRPPYWDRTQRILCRAPLL